MTTANERFYTRLRGINERAAFVYSCKAVLAALLYQHEKAARITAGFTIATRNAARDVNHSPELLASFEDSLR